MADDTQDIESSNDAIDEIYSSSSSLDESAPEPTPKSGPSLEHVDGPVGVDIGTSRIVEFHKDGLRFVKNSQLNAFFPVPNNNFTKNMLEKNNVLFQGQNGTLLIEGFNAENFANISNSELERPMSSGVLNPNQNQGALVIEHLIKSLVEKPKSLGERLCFSMPAPVRGGDPMNNVYHEKIIKDCFISMGYMAKSVNEGHTIVLSELQNDNYTGIGISCGAGLCNVSLSFMSVPILSFSVDKAGDYVDKLAAKAVGEHVNRVRVIKEESLNLISEPKDRIDRALHIYYEDVILNLIQNLKDAMEESENMPKINSPIPIVLSGGTAMVEGFREKFDNILRESNFPLDISEVRMAEEPLFGTARGAYYAACAEDVI